MVGFSAVPQVGAKFTSFEKKKDAEKKKKAKADGLKIDESDQIMKTRQRPKGENSKLAKGIAKYLSGGNAGFNLLRAATQGMSVILEKGLDKEYEYEADHYGVKFAIRAGYQPSAMTEFLNRILAKTSKKHAKVLKKASARLKKYKKKYKDVKERLLSGLDFIGVTETLNPQIDAFEKQLAAERPWQ